jgi:hypothetical protein
VTQTQITVDEEAALAQVLAYWCAKWDFECPALFGLEREEFEKAVRMWDERRELSDSHVARLTRCSSRRRARRIVSTRAVSAPECIWSALYC